MRIMTGIPSSSGLADGPALVYLHSALVTEKEHIPPSRVQKEVDRFHTAVEKVSIELSEMEDDAASKDILETHRMMLGDPEFIRAVDTMIQNEQVTATWAVKATIDEMTKPLVSSKDALFRERAADFEDVSLQIIRVLQGQPQHGLSHLDRDVILVADKLLPSELFSIDKTHVLGIALDGGGPTSHIAILTRSLRIPTVLALGSFSAKVHSGDEVIVDGNYGEVFVRPELSTRQMVKERNERMEREHHQLDELSKLPTVTQDGHAMVILSNIEMVREVPLVKQVGSDGIGLYRSEYLIIEGGEKISEDVQFENYKSVIQAMAPQPVTIRTFDIGGDKVVPGLGIDEQNPILGWRAVRFCLARKDIFSVQLRALLRASVFGKLRIMFPMISGVKELDDVLAVLEHVKQGMDAQHIPYDHDVQIGTMIEVPSAALCADLLAGKVDFFSIGTNDLIQYTLAVDRGNEKIAYLYQPLHPAVLRSIKMIIDKGHAAHIPVGMCGEMAGNSFLSPLLCGLGLDEFSMDPQSVLAVRRSLRMVTYAECQQLAEAVLRLDESEAIKAYMKDWMEHHERISE